LRRLRRRYEHAAAGLSHGDSGGTERGEQRREAALAPVADGEGQLRGCPRFVGRGQLQRRRKSWKTRTLSCEKLGRKKRRRGE
jgi:hypothetical protein